MIKEYSLKRDGEKKVSEHFQVKEFQCKDGSDKILIDTELVNKLEIIRQYFNKPLYITSGYRTESYNKKVSNSTNSYHCKGSAADIRMNGVSPTTIALFCEFYLFVDTGGIGLYKGNGFVHIDTREKKTRWVQPSDSSTYRTVDKICCNL